MARTRPGMILRPVKTATAEVDVKSVGFSDNLTSTQNIPSNQQNRDVYGNFYFSLWTSVDDEEAGYSAKDRAIKNAKQHGIPVDEALLMDENDEHEYDQAYGVEGEGEGEGEGQEEQQVIVKCTFLFCTTRSPSDNVI